MIFWISSRAFALPNMPYERPHGKVDLNQLMRGITVDADVDVVFTCGALYGDALEKLSR